MVTGLSFEDSIPLEDASLSLTIICALYHEFGTWTLFLQEIKRLLKPLGVLVLMDYCPTGRDEVAGPKDEERIPVDVVMEELRVASFLSVGCFYLLEQIYAIIACNE